MVTRHFQARALDELEAFGIFVGRPADNRRQPKLGKNTNWLVQIRSRHSQRTPEEMLQEIYEKTCCAAQD